MFHADGKAFKVPFYVGYVRRLRLSDIADPRLTIRVRSLPVGPAIALRVTESAPGSHDGSNANLHY